MRINTNLTAMNTYTQYTKNQNSISSAVAKLSSGYAINTAADNAAGLAISEKMRAQIRGLDKANANAQDAISLVQTAEGALDSSTQILQRMRELAVQSSSDTNNDAIDRTALQDEFAQLKTELNDISKNTSFNKKNLLDGSLSSSSSTLQSSGLSNINSYSVGQAKAGTYTVSVTTHAAVTASTAPGTAATVTATTASGASITVGSFTAVSTAAYNGNTYTLKVSGTDLSDMTFTLVDSGNKVVAKTEGDFSSLGTGTNTVDVNFSNYGKFTLTGTTGASAQDVSSAAGTTFEFSTDGTDEVVTPGSAAYATLSINGESVDISAGATSAVFKDQGISFSFDAISDADVADPTTFFTGGDIVVGQSAGNALTIQTGANSGDTLKINMSSSSASDLGVSLLDISSQKAAATAIDVVDKAINQVSAQRATLGAIQNRLNYKIDNLNTSSTNLTAAESQIRDVDMAKEMTAFTNANILSQASTAMLAQANSLPQNVLSLIGK